MMIFREAFLISPSGFCERKNLILAKKRLKKLNFVCSYRQDILGRFLCYAGSAQRRVDEMNQAYTSGAQVIFSLIGGMGEVHLVDSLDYDLIRKANKVLVGSSDVTLLLNAIYQKTGARCFHGMNIGKTNVPHKKTISSFLDALERRDYQVRVRKRDIFRKGFIQAPIVGGNVELLGRSLGTTHEIDTDGQIIFLEDYDMKTWRVFDILWQLKIAGKFDGVKGIILGYFTKCGKDIDLYLKEFFKEFTCPVIMHQPIGHQEPNLTIPLGENCIIDTESQFWKISFKK